MATKKALHEALRNRYLATLTDFFTKRDEEVLPTASNEFTIPCLDDEGNEEFVVITVKVPTGSRDGDAYDGYAMAEDFKMKEADKVEKAKAKAEAKAKKIERDKAQREAKAKAKVEHQAEKAKG